MLVCSLRFDAPLFPFVVKLNYPLLSCDCYWLFYRKNTLRCALRCCTTARNIQFITSLPTPHAKFQHPSHIDKPEKPSIYISGSIYLADSLVALLYVVLLSVLHFHSVYFMNQFIELVCVLINSSVSLSLILRPSINLVGIIMRKKSFLQLSTYFFELRIFALPCLCHVIVS